MNELFEFEVFVALAVNIYGQFAIQSTYTRIVLFRYNTVC